ncbi:MAG: uracil-DNA glycosylase [Gemmatimonadetes bacterium]|nr:MAG: uracil-DNA glycosylase [Gemmatimonadota bacterium]
MLHVAFHQCQRCSLGKTRTNFVFGVGNPHADLVFCGEAPGEQEDLKGEPFVGRAGQLLDKILAAIHLHRNDVYILNVLKCRPPGNRDPLPEEREACRPLLEAQLALIKPKVICALGRQAAQALLKTNQSLGKLRGQFHDFNGIPLMVTYHPAALLRNPHWKRPTWDDMQMLRDYYHQLNP